MKINEVKTFYESNEKSILWITILIFLALRVFYIFAFGNFDKSTFLDASGYNEYAKTIVSGTEWLSQNEFLGYKREPGYPLFVATVYAIFGIESFLAVYLIQALLGTLMLCIVYRIAYLSVRSKAVSYISLVWAGFYIFYLRWVGELLRETMVYFLLAYFVFLFLKFFNDKHFRLSRIFWMSLVYTALIHTDGRYLFYAPFLAIPFLMYTKPFWHAIKQYVLFGLFVVLLTLPWTARNYFAYGDVIIVSYYTLNLTGGELSARNELFDTSEIKKAAPSLHYNRHNENYPTGTERELILQGTNPNNRSASEIRAIKQGKRAATSFLGRKWYFFKKMWSPVYFGGAYAPFPMAYFEEGYSKGHNLVSLLQYGLLLPFAIIGMLFILVKKKRVAYLIVFVTIIHMLLHLLTFGIERYRHPVDAFIIIISMYGVMMLLAFARSRFPSKGMHKYINLEHQ